MPLLICLIAADIKKFCINILLYLFSMIASFFQSFLKLRDIALSDNAKVNVFSLDEGGGVSKAGTGGKKYFLTFPDTYNRKTLVIWKQARGDEELEAGFDHFIKAIKFQQK